MALWQIFDKDGVAQNDQFDDGLAFMPDEDGYSTDGVTAHAKSLGKGFTFGLIGVPNWHARVEGEQRVAEAAKRERLAEEAATTAKAAEEARSTEERKAADERAAEQKSAAERRIAEILDPEGFAKAQQIAAIQAEHGALLPFADADQRAALQTLADERIAAL